VVDPLLFAGDLEHQCGQLLWTRADELPTTAALRGALGALVDAADLDAGRAHAWALVRSVDYWLWGLAAGFTEDPVRCRRIAESLR
jgi:streptomycin 6-kinase